MSRIPEICHSPDEEEEDDDDDDDDGDDDDDDDDDGDDDGDGAGWRGGPNSWYIKGWSTTTRDLSEKYSGCLRTDFVIWYYT